MLVQRGTSGVGLTICIIIIALAAAATASVLPAHDADGVEGVDWDWDWCEVETSQVNLRTFSSRSLPRKADSWNIPANIIIHCRRGRVVPRLARFAALPAAVPPLQ